MENVFFDDFSSFPLGPFPYDPNHSAMGEYHCYPEKGYKGAWFDPIADWDYKGPSWLVTSPRMDGCNLMEQMRMKSPREKVAVPVLRAGDTRWRDYRVSVQLRAFTDSEISGILFRYQTSMMHYGFFLKGGSVELQRVSKLERKVLASAPLKWSTDEFHTLEVEVKGSRIDCYADGVHMIFAEDDTYSEGCIALSACMPTQYRCVSVMMEEDALRAFEDRKESDRRRIEEKRSKFPQMKLSKTIDLKDFGAGRQIRFGHLKGDDELFFIMAQNQRRVYKDRYPFISCLTAVSMETGEVLDRKSVV